MPMTKIKYNPSIMSTTFKKVVQDANKEINIAYNKAISIKNPIGFSNSTDLANSINILRMCKNDLQNYLQWIDDIKRNFEDVSNSSIAEVKLTDKIKIPVTEKGSKKAIKNSFIVILTYCFLINDKKYVFMRR